MLSNIFIEIDDKDYENLEKEAALNQSNKGKEKVIQKEEPEVEEPQK